MDVVRFCFASGNQFFTNPDRKREIREPVVMQMADLALSHVEEDQPSAMRSNSYPWPGAYLTLNFHTDGLAQHRTITRDREGGATEALETGCNRGRL